MNSSMSDTASVNNQDPDTKYINDNIELSSDSDVYNNIVVPQPHERQFSNERSSYYNNTTNTGTSSNYDFESQTDYSEEQQQKEGTLYTINDNHSIGGDSATAVGGNIKLKNMIISTQNDPQHNSSDSSIVNNKSSMTTDSPNNNRNNNYLIQNNRINNNKSPSPVNNTTANKGNNNNNQSNNTTNVTTNRISANTRNSDGPNNNNNSGFFTKFYYKLAILPILLLFIRLWGSLRIILEISGRDDLANSGFLKLMQAFFDPSQGFFNAILFVFTSAEDRQRLVLIFAMFAHKLSSYCPCCSNINHHFYHCLK